MVGIAVEGDVRKVADKLSAMHEVDYVVMCAGSFDVLAEIVCEDDERLLPVLNDSIRSIPGVRDDRDLPVPEVGQADLHLGHAMTDPTDDTLNEYRQPGQLRAERSASATCGCTSAASAPTTTARGAGDCAGRGPYVWDQHGKRYLDGLAGLFTSQIGHGRIELAEAARQAGVGSWPTSRCGPTPTPAPSSWPSGWPT